MKKKFYDVIVIGAGHAGIEAATASIRIGSKTCLVTNNISNIGELSCNPSIGGIAKGILIKEIDILGGVMPKIADKASIHFKVLNKSKGPAVWGNRSQIDRNLYKYYTNNILNNYKKLDIIYGIAQNLLISNQKIKGVVINNIKYFCYSVVLTTGTFLNSLMHISYNKKIGGRINESIISKLSKNLKDINFKIGRLKTGTPPRLLKTSINFKKLMLQNSDINTDMFSYLSLPELQKSISCYLCYTNINTHKIIRNNIKKSSIYTNSIISKGPRYCPSIEDKIIQFHNKIKHQIFLEPEGINSNVIYPNGLSTSLPKKIQQELVNSINGLEKSLITQYGYTVEYDYIDPRELKSNLETKKIKNLFFAGQINGTTGYEEAAGQGIIAGINAYLILKKKKLVLNRNSSYIGVMINDLIKNGTIEPYRILTSRSEYRIKLRYDNVLNRLHNITKKFKLINIKQIEDNEKILLKKNKIKNILLNLKIFEYNDLLINIIKKDIINCNNLYDIIIGIKNTDKYFIHQLYSNKLYESYEKKLNKDIKILKENCYFFLIKNINLLFINNISCEIKNNIKKFKPKIISDVYKLKKINPSSLIIILLYIKKLLY